MTRTDAVSRLGLVVGVRPNFVKAAPLLRAFASRGLETTLIHTGQHYDDSMSGVFLRQLGMPRPDVHLRVGSGTQAVQTGRVMARLEGVLLKTPVDRLVVVGDVNSTMAAALVGAKLGIPVDHVEAGLRSGDRSMPEEINRIVTDAVASRLFASEPAGVQNLLREGHPRKTIHLVGNVMIDSLVRLLPRARRHAAWRGFDLQEGSYAVVTLHRPSNVDDQPRLAGFMDVLTRIARRLPVVFPLHPRTGRRLGRLPDGEGFRVCPPLGYLDFLSLMSASRLAITDSGGIQEETTFLDVPCLTVRDTTERPITVTHGTNTLIGADTDLLEAKVEEILSGRYKKGRVPPLWDGQAALRIADAYCGTRHRRPRPSQGRTPAGRASTRSSA